jgi:hypothetical protein
MFWLRLPGSLLLRFATRRFAGLSLIHDPPRNTRFRRPFTLSAHPAPKFKKIFAALRAKGKREKVSKSKG